MKTIENKTEEVKHQWPVMEEYKLDESDTEILMGLGNGNMIDVIKKINLNQYIILGSKGTAEKYNLIINWLKKSGLDIGKGSCEYGWRMPLIKERRELRIFKRH